MAYMSEIGYTLTQSVLWTVLGGLALFGAAFCLFKVVRRNWSVPA
jgi:glycopeptide antibiotics resistance protein